MAEFYRPRTVEEVRQQIHTIYRQWGFDIPMQWIVDYPRSEYGAGVEAREARRDLTYAVWVEARYRHRVHDGFRTFLMGRLLARGQVWADWLYGAAVYRAAQVFEWIQVVVPGEWYAEFRAALVHRYGEGQFATQSAIKALDSVVRTHHARVAAKGQGRVVRQPRRPGFAGTFTNWLRDEKGVDLNRPNAPRQLRMDELITPLHTPPSDIGERLTRFADRSGGRYKVWSGRRPTTPT